LRAAGRKVVVHDDLFAPDASDVEWLRRAGHEGWVVLTRDDMIRRRENEKVALIGAGVRVFVLTGGNLGGPEMAEAFVQALPSMERLVRNRRAPFIARVTRRGHVALVWPPSR
jgi:predicted nuclease of predicted toxin-antitoxin system